MAALIPGLGPMELMICGFPLVILAIVLIAVNASKGKTPQQPSVPAGWLQDPTGRHQLRYWDGTRWTSAVSDNGTQSDDPV